MGSALETGMGLGLALESGFGVLVKFWVTKLQVLLPLGLVLPWGHLSRCRQEGPGPQEVQGAPEAQQLHLVLGLPERDGAWHDSERDGGPASREKPSDGQPHAIPFPSPWGRLKGEGFVTGPLATYWGPHKGTGPHTLVSEALQDLLQAKECASSSAPEAQIQCLGERWHMLHVGETRMSSCPSSL